MAETNLEKENKELKEKLDLVEKAKQESDSKVDELSSKGRQLSQSI